jgi:hypothetical protein
MERDTALMSTEAKPLDLSKLAALARASTPGPWTTEKPPKDTDGWATGVVVAATSHTGRIYADGGKGTRPWADAAYIASFNPEVALAMIARIQDLEAELASWRNDALANALSSKEVQHG